MPNPEDYEGTASDPHYVIYDTIADCIEIESGIDRDRIVLEEKNRKRNAEAGTEDDGRYIVVAVAVIFSLPVRKK